MSESANEIVEIGTDAQTAYLSWELKKNAAWSAARSEAFRAGAAWAADIAAQLLEARGAEIERESSNASIASMFSGIYQDEARRVRAALSSSKEQPG